MTGRYSLFAWQHFGLENGCCLYNEKSGIGPSQVQQGAVGNCWFLSALAVVAEKPYLIRQLLPHDKLNQRGCYQVNLCLDGKWTPIIVDSNLPVVVKDARGQTQQNSLLFATYSQSDNISRTKLRGRDGVPYDICRQDLFAFPAFCATPGLQLWPSMVEKAYAKAHGSYAQLSGGFISEGLYDLTGAPFETIVFAGNLLDYEELWARLLSFHEAGFLMGVATSKGGDGLVGGHAYSVLDVVEVPDQIVGEQLKMTQFLHSPIKKKQKTDKDSMHAVSVSRTTVRLVRIRNPWGKREWKGAWSATSENWTGALRKILGSSSYSKGDGTFFMSYEDMLTRFHHMDVGKTREGWVHTSTDGCFVGRRDPLQTSSSVFRIIPSQRTCAFISICLPKKRSNTGNTFWYVDPSFIIIRRKLSSTKPNQTWDCEASTIVGVKRISTCEVFLDPDHEYYCVPFSCTQSGKAGVEPATFRVCTYSASTVSVEPMCDPLVDVRPNALAALHRELLKADHKLLYPVASRGLLVCAHGHGCVYFLGINGECDKYLSLRLSLDVPNGLLVGFGRHGETFDIPPKSQAICAMVTSNGKFSTATSLKFSYISDVIHANGRNISSQQQRTGLADAIQLTMNGDLLAASIDQTRVSHRGGDVLDTYLWIPQIGQMVG